jgi:hypothetical protein
MHGGLPFQCSEFQMGQYHRPTDKKIAEHALGIVSQKKMLGYLTFDNMTKNFDC